MTEKLYDFAPYENEFEGTVLSCEPCKEGFRVILDRTLFFPEEGGQTPDKGFLENKEVLHVSLEGQEVVHTMAEKVEVGRKICGTINMAKRFSNMQMHSAEHIFSGLVHKQFGYDNVGFHLSDNDATMDYNGKLDGEDIKKLERQVNEAIWKALKINTWYPDEDELSQLDYRSKSGIEGSVRMVEIETIDLCACCAPHVRNTSEIGIFKVVKFENYKGGVRLHYLAGKRAYEFLDNMQETVNELSRKLSSSPDKLIDGVNKLLNDNAELSFAMGKVKRESLINEINKSVEVATAGSVFLFFAGEDNADLLRFGIDKLIESVDLPCFIYSGNDERGYRFILEGHGESVKDIFNEMKEKLSIKGGGKDTSFQGTIMASKQDIENCLR